jgi:DNA repair photolyase
MQVNEVTAKTIMSKTGIPGIAWVVNPYGGCQFGCKYCYAFFVGRFRHPNEEWGKYVDVKINAAELFEKELVRKMAKAKNGDLGEIFFASVTDPYQGLEAKYQLTRKCLEILAKFQYPGKVSILTKSMLVTRDIEIFKKIKRVEVGITVTSLGDPITIWLETYAPPHAERIKALKKLHDAGIKTYAFIGPLLPHYVWKENEMRQLFFKIKEAGVHYIYLEHLNLRTYIKDRLYGYLKKDHPELLTTFKEAESPHYREMLDKMVLGLAREMDLPIAGNSTIHHPEIGSWQG